MTEHKTATREEWLSARRELLERESDFNFDFAASFTEEQRRTGGAEYNFERIDFADILGQFAGSESIAEAAASCATDVPGYVTTEARGLSGTVRRKDGTTRSWSAATTSTRLDRLASSARVDVRRPSGP